MATSSRASKNLIYSNGQSQSRSFIGRIKDNFTARNEKVKQEVANGTYQKNFVDKLVDRVFER